MVGETVNDLRGELAFGEQDGLQMIFERGFYRGDEFGLHFNAGGQQAAHADAIDFGVVETADDLLRASGESLAFLQQLLDDLEA